MLSKKCFFPGSTKYVLFFSICTLWSVFSKKFSTTHWEKPLLVHFHKSDDDEFRKMWPWVAHSRLICWKRWGFLFKWLYKEKLWKKNTLMIMTPTHPWIEIIYYVTKDVFPTPKMAHSYLIICVFCSENLISIKRRRHNNTKDTSICSLNVNEYTVKV